MVSCTLFSLLTSAVEGTVRLVGGLTDAEGRVEVFHVGLWGTVCDDSWDTVDGSVVCRQLGYSSALSVNTSNVPGSGPIWYDNFECLGHETQLIDCSHTGIGNHNCFHFEDAYVTCGSE